MTPNPEIRFLRFEYEMYYPCGASDDLTGRFSTLESALLVPSCYDYAEIYDTWIGEWHDVNKHHKYPK